MAKKTDASKEYTSEERCFANPQKAKIIVFKINKSI
jgi:hypothetical protein